MTDEETRAVRRKFTRKLKLILGHLGDLSREGIPPELVLGAILEAIEDGKTRDSGLYH